MIPNNLFPVAASRGKKTVDVTHHNAGRSQNFNQQLSSQLSWAHLQLSGASANLSNLSRLSVDLKMLSKLPEWERIRLKEILNDTEKLALRLRVIATEVKEFNRTKTKLTKEQMK